MTEEQRKAAIEKAARALVRRIVSSDSTAIGGWNAYTERERQMYRDDAEAALESVGYFELVDVAEKAKRFMQDTHCSSELPFEQTFICNNHGNAGDCDGCSAYLLMCALKEVTPNGR